TDAPAVDVDARGVATLVDNASYRDITDYLTVPPATYTLDVKDSSGAVTVASFTADLSGLANGAAVVFASGFLTPASNQNASAFGLFAALPDGSVIPLSAPTSVEEVGSGVPGAYELSQNYPNPFNPSTQIAFALPEAQTVRLSVFNSLGQQIATLADGTYQAGEYRVTFDATGLPSGMYFYRAEAGSFSAVRKMVLMK
ncbi:MAG: T9SS type A sorting domain-containing protein, partial [Bacteroidetes bacterium]|nr:T9SS type A sorting domain-containing protein [Bacteroidota bacterium]